MNALLLALLALLAGCDRPRAPGLEPAEVWAGPELACAAPHVAPDAAARLREVAAERGLDALVVEPVIETRSCPSIPGGVVSHDLDGDGDVDLAFSNPRGLPDLFENDGRGGFTLWPSPGGQPPADRVEAAAAVDLDGDALPELLLAGWGHVSVAWNLGGMRFSPLEPIHAEPGYPRSCFLSVAAGDLDGDGDLDLAIPGADEIDAEGATMMGPGLLLSGRPDLVLLNEGGVFEPFASLSPPEGPQIALLSVFTDLDGDGDLDLLNTTDRAYGVLSPQQLHINEGLDDAGRPVLVERAEALGFASRVAAMGVEVSDLNADGVADVCVSDHGPDLSCKLSDPSGAWVESGRALGLVAPHADHPALPEGTDEVALGDMMDFWATWSVELIDLDNDGHEELAAAAGGVPHLGDPGLAPFRAIQPDVLYGRTPEGGYEELGHAADFGRVEDHYGLASADLDGDGHRELIVGGWEGHPLLWENPCGEGAWVEIELAGPPLNRQGFGARVWVEAGGQTRMEELHSLRGVGQSDSALHLGLGEARSIDRLVVTWPDGRVQEALDLPVRRVLTLLHPEAPELNR